MQRNMFAFEEDIFVKKEEKRVEVKMHALPQIMKIEEDDDEGTDSGSSSFNYDM